MGSLHEFLNKFSTEIFYIHHKVYRTNHYAQGIIALYRLGASNSRLLEFTNRYLPSLEDANIFKQRDADFTQADVPNLLGKRRGYHVIREFYKDLFGKKYNNSKANLIRGEFPKLCNGIAGAALHGLIQTGYGHSVGNAMVVCEGLALMHYAHTPLIVPEETLRALDWSTDNQRDPMTIIDAVKANSSLVASLKKSGGITKQDPSKSRFQTCMSTLLASHGPELVQLANQMPVPLEPGMELLDRVEVGNFLVDLALTVYMASERVNDFFLLHGVTSAWALRELIPILPDVDVNESVRVFLTCLLAVYASQGSPSLLSANLTIPEGNDEDWDGLVEQTINGLNRDEHTYKLVQVCYDMFMDKPEKNQFYRKAAMIALNNDLAFVNSI